MKSLNFTTHFAGLSVSLRPCLQSTRIKSLSLSETLRLGKSLQQLSLLLCALCEILKETLW